MSKVYLHRTGAMLGRFQGFNLGHKYMADMLLTLCETALIVISDDLVRNIRNPFPKELIKEMIETVYQKEVAEGRLIVTYNTSGHLPDNEWGVHLLKVFYEALGSTPELVIHGDEQCRRGWFNEQQREHITETFIANHPIQNGKILEFRGTMVREALAQGNRRKFESLVDKSLYKYYDKLRELVLEQLNKVTYADYVDCKHCPFEGDLNKCGQYERKVSIEFLEEQKSDYFGVEMTAFKKGDKVKGEAVIKDNMVYCASADTTTNKNWSAYIKLKDVVIKEMK